MVDQMGVDTRGLRRHVGAHAKHAAGQAIDHLEGFQIKITRSAGEQRIEVLHQRRANQVVAITVEQIEQTAAQCLRLPGIRRQDIFDVFGKEPGWGHRIFIESKTKAANRQAWKSAP
jgi:hypothetical protein